MGVVPRIVVVLLAVIEATTIVESSGGAWFTGSDEAFSRITELCIGVKWWKQPRRA